MFSNLYNTSLNLEMSLLVLLCRFSNDEYNSANVDN